MKVLTGLVKTGRMITVRDGWIACPVCGNSRLKRLRPDEDAASVYIHCRRCKNDIKLTLKQGQCLQGQGQQDV